MRVFRMTTFAGAALLFAACADGSAGSRVELAESPPREVAEGGSGGHGGPHGPHGPGFAGPGRFGPEHHLERMKEHLGLTDQQAAQVEPILRAHHERRREMREAAMEERRAAMEAAHAELRAVLAGVLDEAQLAKFDEHAARRRARLEHHRRGGGHHGHGPHGRGRHRLGPPDEPPPPDPAADPNAI